ncbi:transporter substrate-binding domain-containing protein [Aliiglaciecola sp. 3_MG-2023]|uniref:ABC transporter substrate-binding protein n=1 Tax=Aliiglaciecola sp. 3_MG-2023 TaxID=3062644 RepID=UPI0026E2AD3C|nr:transporter substrate-binding domain-containing protein [Aliiglaciecola sp. 3_MG-2023]MDO6694595.1 transporter substrate-binding domain-containing protein [Aliiglaciecola sp. 3_MG-2023]
MRISTFLVVFLWLLFGAVAQANDTIRVGVLKYGTLNWEMDVLEKLQLAKHYNLKIERIPLGSPQALLVALQGGSVDVILNDWLWVARQKEAARDFYFYPYSTAAGALVTHPQAKIKTLADLRGKTIGIAGGNTNKNWVLYRAFLKQQANLDLAQDLKVKFAAPPMLNALLSKGDLDAVVNFWHYAAQLNAQGMTSLVTMPEVLEALKVEGQVPVLGWVFKQQWADDNKGAINRFLSMSAQARQRMKLDDDIWSQIPTLTQKYPAHVQPFLIDGYRQGIPDALAEAQKIQIDSLFQLIKANDSQQVLTGNLGGLPDDIFWRHSDVR